ncbi:MAG: T9SS type A sorting domain-containing protein [Bacteroidales bacterium]
MKKIYLVLLFSILGFSVNAQFGTLLNEFTLEKDKPTCPWGIAVSDSKIYVGDFDFWGPGQSIISVYDMEGKFIKNLDISSWAACPQANEMADMAYHDGMLYMMGNDGTIKKVNANTGELVETSQGNWSNHDPKGIAYDANNDVFYIGGWNVDPGILKVKFDGEELGGIAFDGVYSLAFHPGTLESGTLFVTDGKKMIHEVNPETGETIQSFKSDVSMMGGVDINEYGHIYVVDQKSRKILCYDSGNAFFNPKAPIGVENLEAKAGPKAELKVELTWNFPTKAMNGDDLTGKLSYKVHVNDSYYTEIEEGKDPGSKAVFVDDAAKQGFNKYTVHVSNENGSGISKTIFVYAGLDTPGPVSNIKLKQTEKGQLSASLSWDAPTEGTNGGYFDGQISSYKIIRYPDKKEFTKGDELDQNVFIDIVPKSFYYHYKIIPVSEAGEGSAASSYPENIFDNDQLFFDAFFPYENRVWDTKGGENWMISDFSCMAGGEAPEAGFHYQPKVVAFQEFISPFIEKAVYTDKLYMSFTYSMQDVKGGYEIYLACAPLTTTNPDDYEKLYTFPIETTEEPKTVKLEMNFDNVPNTMESDGFRLYFVFNGNSDDIQYFAFDDISIRTKPYTAIQEIGNIETSIYPNPCTNELNIHLNSTEIVNNLQINIKDALGRTLLTEKYSELNQKQSKFVIPTAQLSKGLYFVEVISNNRRFVKKLLK